MSFHVPEKFRVKTGVMKSDQNYGNNGAFLIASVKLKPPLKCIASDGLGWEHVSVSALGRCPTWDEMCFIKSLFWDETDCVIQYHPEEKNYINNHSFCLHLWRPVNESMPIPPYTLVGIKNNCGSNKDVHQ